MSKHLILASKSAGRKLILEKLGIPFEVIVSNFEEDMSLPLSAPELALYLSKGKAGTLVEKYPEAIIIAADTFLVFEDKFLGKPKDESDAKVMLKKLSGRTHIVVTGMTVRQGKKEISEVVNIEVTMKNFDEQKINEYVASGEPLDKAGSYAIQGKGAELVEKINGDVDSVVGLPLNRLVEILEDEFGVQAKTPKTP
ncbi:MAG: Maf family protein [Patescibacteria group bacterium]